MLQPKIRLITYEKLSWWMNWRNLWNVLNFCGCYCALSYRPWAIRSCLYQDLCSVHTSNNVETTFDFVEATFDFVAKIGNNVERFYCKISFFRQSRNKLNIFSLFRLCGKDEISFEIVAKTATLLRKTATMSKQHSTLSKESVDL